MCLLRPAAMRLELRSRGLWLRLASRSFAFG